MQPASDIFLGWSRGPKRHFFLRQLRDMKLGVMAERSAGGGVPLRQPD
jgi:hypothetical protein